MALGPRQSETRKYTTSPPTYFCDNGCYDEYGWCNYDCNLEDGANQCSQYDPSEYTYWALGCENGDPIVIDTKGIGFHLTGAKDGVLFNVNGKGVARTSWTRPGSGNGWLALDRNANGNIDSMRELFGNYTPQQHTRQPNGFHALSVFDLRVNGGNNDGWIDAKDAVWTKLRVWIDENQDGVSQPHELHTLDSLGITAIGLSYKLSVKDDEFGNRFRYTGSLKDIRG